MDVDIFSPEFLEFTDKVKSLNKVREDKLNAFKEIHAKLKAELAEFDTQAEALKKDFADKTAKKKEAAKTKF